GNVTIRNGLWTTLAHAGMAMQLSVDVTGGGVDGLLGLDRVFGGLVNNLSHVDINAVYHDGVAAHPNHHWINRDVSNGGAATGGSAGGTPVFQPGDPAPVPYSWPLLDSGRSPNGIGGDTATMGRSRIASRVAAPGGIGQRWAIECMDSPGRSFDNTH